MSYYCSGPRCNNSPYYYNPNGIYYSPNSGDQPFYNPNSGGNSGADSTGTGYYAGNQGWWWGDPQNRNAFYIRIGHGILASLAFVFFFPVGAILMRLIPGRFAVWIHAACQMFAYLLFIIAAALGFWMLTHVNVPFFDLLNHAHTIIGIVLFALILFQPFLGALHHSSYRRTGRRSFWSHIHIWLGRILITIGMINGGIGIRLAGNTRGGAIAYGAVAGLMWVLWMLTACASEILGCTRRHQRRKERKRGKGPARNVPAATMREGPDTRSAAPVRTGMPHPPLASGADGKIEHYG